MHKFESIKEIQSQPDREKSRLSIAVRVKNEIKWIGYFFASLKRQSFYEYLDIVVLDSGSTDGTLEFLIKERCSLYTIDSSEFSFGETCNLMMQLTKCSHVLFFSGHVEIIDRLLAETVYNFIKSNGDLSGYFRQVPNEVVGCSIYDKVFLKYNFPSKDGKSPIYLNKRHRFSNAASIIARKHWDLVKFEKVIASEDAIWADEVVELFGGVYYFHHFDIKHSHNESFEDVERRVSINMRARFPGGISFQKRLIAFAKVFFALYINTFKFKESLGFASAHARGYKL